MWVFVALFTTLLALFILNRWHKLTYFQRMGIPGPKPSFVFGNIAQLKALGSFEGEKLWIKKYGQVFGIYFGPRPTLIVSDREILREVLVKQCENFYDRPKGMFPLKLQEPIDKTVLALRGQHWRRVRMGISPAFSGAHMRQVSSRLSETLAILMDILRESARGNQEVDLYARYKSFILDIIAGCGYGIESHDVQRDPRDPFLGVVKRWFEATGSVFGFIAMLFPEARLPLTFLANRFTNFAKSTDDLTDLYKRIVQEKRTNSEGARADLLQVLVDVADGKIKSRGLRKQPITVADDAEEEKNEKSESKSGSSRDEPALTENEVLAQAFVFLFGGFDTTSRSLSYASFLLATNPDAQEKLFSEICDNVEEDEEITYDTLKKLPYLDMVMSETLRMYPAFPSLPKRECTKACTIKGIRFEPGVSVQAPVYFLHHDPEIWENPDDFEPERFNDENKAKIPPFTYMPFGQGPRYCVGQRFALLVAKITLLHLVKRFKLVETENTEAKFKYNFSPIPILGKSDWGVHVKLVPRLD